MGSKPIEPLAHPQQNNTFLALASQQLVSAGDMLSIAVMEL